MRVSSKSFVRAKVLLTKCEEVGECFQYNEVNICTINRSAVFVRDFLPAGDGAESFSFPTVTLDPDSRMSHGL